MQLWPKIKQELPLGLPFQSLQDLVVFYRALAIFHLHPPPQQNLFKRVSVVSKPTSLPHICPQVHSHLATIP